MAWDASTNSSVLRWLSLVASAELAAGGLPWSWAGALPPWAKAPPVPISKARPAMANRAWPLTTKRRKTATVRLGNLRRMHSPTCFRSQDSFEDSFEDKLEGNSEDHSIATPYPG